MHLVKAAKLLESHTHAHAPHTCTPMHTHPTHTHTHAHAPHTGTSMHMHAHTGTCMHTQLVSKTTRLNGSKHMRNPNELISKLPGKDSHAKHNRCRFTQLVQETHLTNKQKQMWGTGGSYRVATSYFQAWNKLNCEKELRQNMVQSEHNAIEVLVTALNIYIL